MPIAPTGGKRLLAGAALGLVVGLIAGYGLGRLSLGPGIGADGSYEEGLRSARERLVEAGIVPSSMPDVRAMSGTVTAAGERSLTLEVADLNVDPLSDTPTPPARTVLVTAETRIIRQVPKDPAVFQQEVAAFQADASGTPPQPFVEEELALEDISIGARVAVEAEMNIYDATSFEATTVFILDAAAGGSSGTSTEVPPPIAPPAP